MNNHVKGIETFLNSGWGKRATQYLKDGATFKLIIDKETYSLLKGGGKMQAIPGAPENYDVVFEISSSAVKYLQEAKDEDDAHKRLGELIYHPTQDKYARMKIEAEPTEKGRIAFYWKGFFFWARRMGFAS